jgi:hypothetical protein
MIKKLLFKIKRRYKNRGFFGLIKIIFFYPRNLYHRYIGVDYLENKDLKKLIKNQRVLVLGSGPSKKDLLNIPKDVRIFTCNMGPEIIDREIDVYYCEKDCLNNKIRSLLSKINIKYFISDSKNTLRSKNVKFIKDYKRNTFYLRNIIYPMTINDFMKDLYNTPSSGVRLIQYALYLNAKEIFIIGLDGGTACRSTDLGIDPHQPADSKFKEIISKKYKNIYSASKNSPITKYLEYKELK